MGEFFVVFFNKNLKNNFLIFLKFFIIKQIYDLYIFEVENNVYINNY